MATMIALCEISFSARARRIRWRALKCALVSVRSRVARADRPHLVARSASSPAIRPRDCRLMPPIRQPSPHSRQASCSPVPIRPAAAARRISASPASHRRAITSHSTVCHSPPASCRRTRFAEHASSPIPTTLHAVSSPVARCRRPRAAERTSFRVRCRTSVAIAT